MNAQWPSRGGYNPQIKGYRYLCLALPCRAQVSAEVDTCLSPWSSIHEWEEVLPGGGCLVGECRFLPG